MLVHCRVTPSINSLLPIYTHEWREALRELSVFPKNTIASLARARTRTAWSGERNLIFRVSHSLKDCRWGMNTSTRVVMLVLLTSCNGQLRWWTGYTSIFCCTFPSFLLYILIYRQHWFLWNKYLWWYKCSLIGQYVYLGKISYKHGCQIILIWAMEDVFLCIHNLIWTLGGWENCWKLCKPWTLCRVLVMKLRQHWC